MFRVIRNESGETLIILDTWFSEGETARHFPFALLDELTFAYNYIYFRSPKVRGKGWTSFGSILGGPKYWGILDANILGVPK